MNTSLNFLMVISLLAASSIAGVRADFTLDAGSTASTTANATYGGPGAVTTTGNGTASATLTQPSETNDLSATQTTISNLYGETATALGALHYSYSVGDNFEFSGSGDNTATAFANGEPYDIGGSAEADLELYFTANSTLNLTGAIGGAGQLTFELTDLTQNSVLFSLGDAGTSIAALQAGHSYYAFVDVRAETHIQGGGDESDPNQGAFNFSLSTTPAAVPEPMSAALLAGGLAVLGIWRFRRA